MFRPRALCSARRLPVGCGLRWSNPHSRSISDDLAYKRAWCSEHRGPVVTLGTDLGCRVAPEAAQGPKYWRSNAWPSLPEWQSGGPNSHRSGINTTDRAHESLRCAWRGLGHGNTHRVQYSAAVEKGDYSPLLTIGIACSRGQRESSPDGHVVPRRALTIRVVTLAQQYTEHGRASRVFVCTVTTLRSSPHCLACQAALRVDTPVEYLNAYRTHAQYLHQQSSTMVACLGLPVGGQEPRICIGMQIECRMGTRGCARKDGGSCVVSPQTASASTIVGPVVFTT